MILRRGMLCASALLLLSACTAAPATRLYLLRPVSDTPIEKSTPVVRYPHIVIREVRLPQYLDRPQIVTRGTGDRLVINEYAHWGSNFRDEMTRVLAENLAVLLTGSRVMVAPVHHNVPQDQRIDLEVTHFERQMDGQVRLSARWWIEGGEGREPATALTGEASLMTTPAGDSYEALAAAMSSVYGELALAIATAIRQGGR